MIRKDYTHNATKKSACHHLADDEEFVRRLVQETLNEVLESEMTEFLGADKSERTKTRQGYRSGYYRRDLTMKVGEIELRVPQERSGQFSTRVFESAISVRRRPWWPCCRRCMCRGSRRVG